MIRIAILDDYQNASLKMADWSPLIGRAAITVFDDHLSDSEAVVERLLRFDAVCVMRERTPLPRSVIERLPQLKLIASTGPRNAPIDVDAAAERGIVVAHTGYDARPTIEMTWALILLWRHGQEHHAMVGPTDVAKQARRLHHEHLRSAGPCPRS